MRMYFLVNAEVPKGFAINSVAHGSMMAHSQWKGMVKFDNWFTNSFKKVTCKASSQEEFDNAKKLGTHLIVTESALGGKETVLVFYPTDEKLPFKLY